MHIKGLLSGSAETSKSEVVTEFEPLITQIKSASDHGRFIWKINGHRLQMRSLLSPSDCYQGPIVGEMHLDSYFDWPDHRGAVLLSLSYDSFNPKDNSKGVWL